MNNQLLNKSSYLNTNIPFLISTYIREYDMAKSNISILKYKGVLSQNEYDYYSNLPKDERQRSIGLLQRNNPEIIDILKSGMKEMRNNFIINNNLSPLDILSIKNDAFFIINSIPTNTVFDNIEFRLKNTYTSYYFIDKLEYYYFYNQVNQEEILDIKGVSDDKLSLHENYFLDMLKTVFCSAQNEDIKETVSLLSFIYEKYIKRELSIEYYRELNPISKIKVNVEGKEFLVDHLSEEEKYYVDISYNLNIIRILLSYYSSILQRRR